MGARQSKRSVDISGATKKGEVENGGVEGEGKLERLEEGGDVVANKATQNGTAPHAEKEPATPVTEEAQPVVNGDSGKTETTEELKAETEESKSGDKKDESLINGAPESPESKDKSTDEAAATPDKEKKKKKEKKKWSIRSISFSRKDKSKPNIAKDEAKNGNITKEDPVAEVVEAEAAPTTEAIPIKNDEPKKEETTERTEVEEEKKKEEKAESSTAVQSTEPASPVPAQTETIPAPEPEPAPVPEPVTSPAPAPAHAPTPVIEPVEETVVVPQPAPPTIEAIPDPVVEKPEEVAVVEQVVETKTEPELPPPLPASPPPTEAPPPTPVAPAPASQIPDVEPDTQETEVVGGGGESMAEPEDVEPVLEGEKIVPLVNGISDHSHEIVEEFTEKVDLVTENLKTMIVTESLISTQVTDKSEDNSEQTASAAE